MSPRPRVAIVDIQCLLKDKQWLIKEFSIKPVFPYAKKTLSLMFSHSMPEFANNENKFTMSYIDTDYKSGDLQYNPNVISDYVNQFDILLVKGKNKMLALKNCFMFYYQYDSEHSRNWLDVWFKPLEQAYIKVYNIDDAAAYRSTAAQSFLSGFDKPTFSLMRHNYNNHRSLQQRQCHYNHNRACAFRNVWKIYRKWWQKNESKL
jgi:hypothetical protein